MINTEDNVTGVVTGSASITGNFLRTSKINSSIGSGTYVPPETDPTVPSHVKEITEEDITRWNEGTDTSNFYTKEEVDNKGYLTSVPDEYVTEEELDNKGYLTEHQDLSEYATIDALNNKAEVTHTHSQYLTEIPSEYITETELNEKGFLTKEDVGDIDVDLTDYYTKTEIDNKGYLTSVPSEYITETELNAKKYLTSVPSEYVTETELTNKGYASESYVKNAIANAELSGGDVDLSGYATKDELNAKASIADMEAYIEENKDELKGDKGDKGDTGPQGPQGEQGIQGIQGPKGDTGAAGKDGTNGTNGTNGKDGTSCTHSWSGTTLSVTSSSGTSSANLKGEKGETGATGATGPKGDKGDTGSQGPKGDKGDTGSQGPAGADGKTPVKGTDYYTAADKAEMIEEVANSLPIGSLSSLTTTEKSTLVGAINELDNNKINKSTVIYDLDFNTVEDTSYYFCLGDISNGPGNNAGYLFTQVHNTQNKYQRFKLYNSNKVYERQLINGTWSSWEPFDSAEIGSVAALTTTNKNTLVGAINEVNKTATGAENAIANLNIRKLWENPNQNADFEAQKINLSSGDYDYLIFVYKHYPTYTQDMGQYLSTFVPKGYGCVLTDVGNYGIGGNYDNVATYRRQIERVSDTQFDVKTCGVTLSVSPYWKDVINYLLPIYVYGGKFK